MLRVVCLVLLFVVKKTVNLIALPVEGENIEENRMVPTSSQFIPQLCRAHEKCILTTHDAMWLHAHKYREIFYFIFLYYFHVTFSLSLSLCRSLFLSGFEYRRRVKPSTINRFKIVGLITGKMEKFNLWNEIENKNVSPLGNDTILTTVNIVKRLDVASSLIDLGV